MRVNWKKRALDAEKDVKRLSELLDELADAVPKILHPRLSMWRFDRTISRMYDDAIAKGLFNNFDTWGAFNKPPDGKTWEVPVAGRFGHSRLQDFAQAQADAIKSVCSTLDEDRRSKA